jgi:hypothetical protein
MLNENLLVPKAKRASGRLITDCERVVGKYEAAGAADAAREISRHV